MMRVKASFQYYEDSQVQTLGVSYVGEDIRMFILLPKERYGLHKLLTSLNGTKLSMFMAKHPSSVVDVRQL